MAEIVNRVANSKLKTFDLEDIYPSGERVQIDISQWLFQGFILKEKDFRKQLKEHNWSAYKDAYVALHCSTDAILPAYTYLLVNAYLANIAKKVVQGNLDNLELVLFTETIQQLDLDEYENAPLIIKGCTNKPIPESAYLLLFQKLEKVAKSIMFGEACSSVPIYKKKK